jgi:hypothetical protein
MKQVKEILSFHCEVSPLLKDIPISNEMALCLITQGCHFIKGNYDTYYLPDAFTYRKEIDLFKYEDYLVWKEEDEWRAVLLEK